MSIYLGSNKINELYLGSQKIGSIYLGTQKVYSSGPNYSTLYKRTEELTYTSNGTNSFSFGKNVALTDSSKWYLIHIEDKCGSSAWSTTVKFQNSGRRDFLDLELYGYDGHCIVANSGNFVNESGLTVNRQTADGHNDYWIATPGKTVYSHYCLIHHGGTNKFSVYRDNTYYGYYNRSYDKTLTVIKMYFASGSGYSLKNIFMLSFDSESDAVKMVKMLQGGFVPKDA